MQESNRRVVITGLGALTPLAANAHLSYEKLLAGENGISPIVRWDASKHGTQFAGEVQGVTYDPNDHFSRLEQRRLDIFAQIGLVAAREAMKDAGLEKGAYDSTRTAAILGTGIGGIGTIEKTAAIFREHGPRRVTPYFIPATMSNALPGNIAIEFGVQGSCFLTSSACASSGHAIGLALQEVRSGRSDVALTGGAETTTTPLTVAGFNSLKALSTRNEDPGGASRPFDTGRDGFVIGEGAGVLVLESLEHAQARGAKIYCELAGFGQTDDAHHITAPEESGAQPARAMRAAMALGGIQPEEVGYINAHGTSTFYNDMMETRAIKQVLGEEQAKRVAVSSTKSMIGHLIGAAAAVEAVVTALTLKEGKAHPTRNLVEPDVEQGCDLDYIPGEARSGEWQAALSNSFGFGGHNVTLAFRRYD